MSKWKELITLIKNILEADSVHDYRIDLSFTKDYSLKERANVSDLDIIGPKVSVFTILILFPSFNFEKKKGGGGDRKKSN